MAQNAGQWLARTACLLLLILSVGCTTTGFVPDEDRSQDSQAAAYFRAGQFEQVALAWQQTAVAAEPGAAALLWVRAADAWMLAGQPARARDALKWVDDERLPSADRARLNLVRADLALYANRPDQALSLLQGAESSLSADSRSRYRDLTERASDMLAGPASRDIARAMALSDSMSFYATRSALELVQTLQSVSSGELQIRSDRTDANPQMAGWFDLALTIRQNLVQPQAITAAISKWKQRHPDHLLEENQALETFLTYRQQFRPPARVAVILPESGRLQGPAAAIRDGLMEAWLRNPGGAELRFFASNDDPQSSIAAYFSALDSGADLVIGPLRREEVSAMLSLAGLSTPVLALNELPTPFTPPAGLEGQIMAISLSQEKEAAASARRAIQHGYQNAIIVSPQSAWGDRMSEAFRDEFLQEDQQILAAARYQERQNDHSQQLEVVLKIDQSKARKNQLENTLQQTLEFEAARRSDVDVIFLAANTTQARLIRPQLKFLDAGDIPIFATGRVFTGIPNDTANRDLNGVEFPATAWQITHNRKQDMPALESLAGGRSGPLFALGQDAWDVLPWMSLLCQDPDFIFQGQSGQYTARADGNLERNPSWAVFRNGYPVMAPLPPPPDSIGAEKIDHQRQGMPHVPTSLQESEQLH